MNFDTLIGKVRGALMSKAKQGINRHRFPWAGRCKAHHVQWLLGKTNTITPNVPPFLLLFPSVMPYGVEYPI